MKPHLTLILLSAISSQVLAQMQVFDLKEGVPLEMVFVEGGTFVMGNDKGKADARPAHKVTLRDFHIGKFEVTQAQWTALMDINPSRIACANCPVNDMSWDQLQEFIERLNKRTGKKFRLPTEAEWEYAAQGGKHSKNYRYSGGDSLPELGWLDFNSGARAHPVGLLKPNELGLYDMNGNVWELCEDWYDPKYYKRSPTENPVNTKPAKYRVSRGASWMSPAHYCQRNYRNNDHPHHKRGNGGFRLVMDP